MIFPTRFAGGLAAVAGAFVAVSSFAAPAFAESPHQVKARLDGVALEVTGVTIGQADYTPPGKDFVPTSDDYLKIALRITNTGPAPLYIQKYWTNSEATAGKQVLKLHDMASILLVDVRGDVFNVEVAPGASVDDLLLFRGVDRASPPKGKIRVTAEAPFFRQPGMVALKRREVGIVIDAGAISVEPRREAPAAVARRPSADAEPEAEPLSPEDALLLERLRPLFAVEPTVRDGVVTLTYEFASEDELADFQTTHPEWVELSGGLTIKKTGKVTSRARFAEVDLAFEATFGYLSSGTSSFTVTLAEDEPGDFIGSHFGVQAISVREKRVKRSNPRKVAVAKMFRVHKTYAMRAAFDGKDVTGWLDGKRTGRLTKVKGYEAGSYGFELSETNVTIRKLVVTGKLDPEWLGRQPRPAGG